MCSQLAVGVLHKIIIFELPLVQHAQQSNCRAHCVPQLQNYTNNINVSVTVAETTPVR